jgi:hypothetical protein
MAHGRPHQRNPEPERRDADSRARRIRARGRQDRLRGDGITVDANMFCGLNAEGELRLLDGHITGTLALSGATLTARPGGKALSADRITVGGNIFCQPRFKAKGEVRLLGARIDGQLGSRDASLSDNGTKVALDCESLQAESLWLDDATVTGTVNLVGARIGSLFSCRGAQLRNYSGPALLADGLQVGQDMQCDRLTADGGIVLGGHIGRLLSFEGATLNNLGGSALLSDGLRVDGAMFCRNGFTAQGEIRLPGARIAGRLYFDGAKLSNPGGRALVASRLTVGLDMFCRKQRVPEHEEAFFAEGAVILTGAHVGGNLEWTAAQLHNNSGPALQANRLQVDQAMLLNGRFTATGSGEDGAVRLSGAHIGGSLTFDGAILRGWADLQWCARAELWPAELRPGAELWRALASAGGSCCGMAPPLIPRSRISNWPPDTGRLATTGRPARP